MREILHLLRIALVMSQNSEHPIFITGHQNLEGLRLAVANAAKDRGVGFDRFVFLIAHRAIGHSHHHRAHCAHRFFPSIELDASHLLDILDPLDVKGLCERGLKIVKCCKVQGKNERKRVSYPRSQKQSAMSQAMNMQPEAAVPGSPSVATPIILIDDDPKLCELIRDYLAPLGYDVASANTGPEGLEKVLNGDYRAVILDVMLPGMDGFEVLKAIRHQSNVPVLMLTGRGDEADRVVGLEIGADDYLPKTFSTRELLARLRAVMRRAPSKAGANAIDKSEAEVEADLTNGNLVISPGSRTAALGDVPLKLTSLEFDLLLSLTRARGRVKSREQILDDVAGRDYDVFDRSIDVHVSALRQKLGDDPKAPTFIQTVRSVGYMMIKQ